jgi:hypothetical protein
MTTLDIFHCLEARLHTLPDAPTLRMANHEQLVAHHNRLETRNADKGVPRFGTDPDNDGEDFKFFTWCCHSMLEQEDFWSQCGLVWAWIDERPVWSPVHWTCGEFGVLPEPDGPILRRFRLTLLGGGQIRVSEQFEPMSVSRDDGTPRFIRYEPKLRVTADAGEGLRRFNGIIDGPVYEMSARAAVFLPGTPQSIADRVAATFRLLTYADRLGTSVRSPDPNNFMALLDRSERCCICRRSLHDHVSTLLGIGPDCARQMRLPHSLEAANRILERRKQLLGLSELRERNGGGAP